MSDLELVCIHAPFVPGHRKTRRQRAARSETKPPKRPADGSRTPPSGLLDGALTAPPVVNNQSDGYGRPVEQPGDGLRARGRYFCAMSVSTWPRPAR